MYCVPIGVVGEPVCHTRGPMVEGAMSALAVLLWQGWDQVTHELVSNSGKGRRLVGGVPHPGVVHPPC